MIYRFIVREVDLAQKDERPGAPFLRFADRHFLPAPLDIFAIANPDDPDYQHGIFDGVEDAISALTEPVSLPA